MRLGCEAERHARQGRGAVEGGGGGGEMGRGGGGGCMPYGVDTILIYMHTYIHTYIHIYIYIYIYILVYYTQ